MKQGLKIVFAGTPEFGLPSLKAIADSTHQLAAVYTQPDRPAGRGRKLQASAIKQWAQAACLDVYQPLNFKSPEALETLAAIKPDVLVVIAYGLILPKAVLDIPRYGCINVHASLLPRWRGASPIQQAVLHGDAQSGVTIMQMDQGLDTGDMLATAVCALDENETSATLHDKLAQMAPEPLLQVLAEIQAGQTHPRPQVDSQATYAGKIQKDQARIDWQQSAAAINRQIRAFNPWPVAFSEGLRIFQAQVDLQPVSAEPGTVIALEKQGMRIATGEGSLWVERLQFAGGKVLAVSDWINSVRADDWLGRRLS